MTVAATNVAVYVTMATTTIRQLTDFRASMPRPKDALLSRQARDEITMW